MNPSIQWSAVSARRRMDGGSLTPTELLAGYLERIGRRDPSVRAWRHLDVAQATAAAKHAEGSTTRGKLWGIPVAIKDIVDTADMPTGYGSRIYADHRPVADAACVARIRDAGGIILGKTVSTEFAYFEPGPTANPHAIQHTPGGSSSGSAAAVADRMAPLAIGTQTAGSLIRPAAYCGVLGYKSSHGLFSLAGIKTFAHSFDSLGLFARHTADLALLAEVILGSEVGSAAPAASPVIGVCRIPGAATIDEPSERLLGSFVNALAAAGAKTVELDFPHDFVELAELHKLVMAYEATRNYSFELLAHRPAMSVALLALLDSGARVSIADYRAARRKIRGWAPFVQGLFERYDALLAPSAPGVAPLAASGTGDPWHSRIWTALGLPSISVPIGADPTGLPIGAQLIGAHLEDGRLLGTVQWIEDAGLIDVRTPGLTTG
jgi:Asp-tRNA(Asn)/Glu-tRNA(Gln) amidotransferase A subunit family amidase